MLICPKCKSEYQEGYKSCNDCKCNLIEIPEAIPEKTARNKHLRLMIPFIIGIILILCSPFLSYKLTTQYFIPGGTGIYNNDHFIWMLHAYQYSFLLVGGLLCFITILQHKKEN
ncbi:MAG: hypothetical protein K0S41_3014 [Anaerocolumna sp.]|jgi:hypothetical protein|nr:hypothetical protein [Anaerocolumna sp.]